MPYIHIHYQGERFEWQNGWTDEIGTDVAEFLAILLTFRNLQALALETQYHLRTNGQAESKGTDPDYDNAEIVTREVHLMKLGVRLCVLRIFLTHARQRPSWKPAKGTKDKDLLHTFKPWRIFRSTVGASTGVFEQVVAIGNDRVDANAADAEIDRRLRMEIARF